MESGKLKALVLELESFLLILKANRTSQTNRDKEYSLEMERKQAAEGQVREFDDLMSRLGPLEAGRSFSRDETNER